MKRKIFKQHNSAFTIIETMIAVALFFVVVMIGMDSLLNASNVHKKSQDQRSIMDNLTFIMEDMSRNIRTGYNYRCLPTGTLVTPAEISGSPQSCPNKGASLIFTPGDGSTPWAYKVEVGTSGSLGILKSTDGAQTWTQLNPDDSNSTSSISFDPVTGFTVTGAEPPSSGNSQQPMVTITLVGKVTTNSITTPFSLQTTVSQRVIDQ